jgi:hypothetical protein
MVAIMPPRYGNLMENLGRNDDLLTAKSLRTGSPRFLHDFSIESPSQPINLVVKIDSRGKLHEPTTIR